MEQRNSHWRVQSFIGHPQAIKNDSGRGPTFDENNITINPTMLTGTQRQGQSDPSRDVTCKAAEQLPELANKVMPVPMSLQTTIPNTVQSDCLVAHPFGLPVSDAQSADFSITNDTMNQQEELTIEGGTISISSVYSQGWVQSLSLFIFSPFYLYC